MEITYDWKAGARTRGLDIHAVVPALQGLASASGTLIPEEVVREARKKKSPLHPWFEWDDTEAARQYRLEQARDLIRSVAVTYIQHGEEQTTVRAFVHLGDQDGYEDTTIVLQIADRRALLLQRALRELESVRKKYEDIEELAAVFAAVSEARRLVA